MDVDALVALMPFAAELGLTLDEGRCHCTGAGPR